jgi:ribosomal protein L11 methyltransferase
MNRFYYELVIKTNINKDILSNFVLEFVDAVEEDDDVLIVRSEDDLSDLSYALDSYVKELKNSYKIDIFIDTVLDKKRNVDWIDKYKKSITSIEAGSFYIHPPWNPPKFGLINIEIEPSLAFGSGHHNTTRSCLKLIDTLVKPSMSMLDVGCGSGILSIASQKKGAEVSLCDTDEISIENATDNFKINNSKFKEMWVGSASSTDNRYDIVVANIVADVLVMIASDLISKLNSGGLLVLSGIIEDRKDMVLDKFSNLSLVEIMQDGEWFSIVYKR